MDSGNEAQKSKARKFLQAVEVLCRKHGCWISHEDGHGGFEMGGNSPIYCSVKILEK